MYLGPLCVLFNTVASLILGLWQPMQKEMQSAIQLMRQKQRCLQDARLWLLLKEEEFLVKTS